MTEAGETLDLATAVATRRMVASVVLIGVVAVLGTCAVIYSGYVTSRDTLLARYARDNLTLARTITEHVGLVVLKDREQELSEALRAEAYATVERMWRSGSVPEDGSLAIVEAPGTVVYHTSRPDLVMDVRSLELRPADPGGPTSIEGLFRPRRDGSGVTGRFLGEEQLFGAAHLAAFEALVLVQIPKSRALRELRAAGMPRSLVFAAVAGLLVPLALGLLYRSFRLAQQSALSASTSLRESEARYRSLYHGSPIMMHSIDRQGRLVQVNDHWLATLGYERGEVLGLAVSGLLTKESREYAEEVVLPSFFETGVASDVPYQVVKKDGGVVDVLLSATAERDDNGEVSQSRAILVDVTAQRKAESDREAVIRQLEQKNAELKRFTYTVSHDLKSPLVTIKGFLGYMRKDLGSGQVERALADLDRVSEAAERMRELLDDLLELSRVGRMAHPPEDVDLYDLAREAVEQVKGALDERSVTVDVSPELPDVRCDRRRMLQVLQNLLENAVKFMGESSEPRIEIGCRQDGGETVCFVADNGIGIAPQDQERIFGLFHKLESGREGTGIGLALVQRIIEVHGGRVWVESDGVGKGSAFCFTLPVAAGPSESGILNLKDLGLDHLKDSDGR